MKNILLWFKIVRPQTLFASLCPVLVALMVVYWQGYVVQVFVAIATILCALALQILSNLINDYYDFKRGTFRVNGDTVDIFTPDSEETVTRITFFDDEIERISFVHAITGKTQWVRNFVEIYPASHYATGKAKLERAITNIESKNYYDKLKDYVGNDLFNIDVNGPIGLDNLANPHGVILESEQLLADFTHADHSFFLINGTSYHNWSLVFDKLLIYLRRNK